MIYHACALLVHLCEPDISAFVSFMYLCALCTSVILFISFVLNSLFVGVEHLYAILSLYYYFK